MSDNQQKLIEIKHLKKYFNLGHDKILKAVDDINLDIYKGETVGLVGESGCGKSTTGRTIIRMYDATEGQVIYNGKNIHELNRKELKGFTQKAQMIFQDPYASLNPRMIVGDIISEGMDIHHMYSGKERQEKVYELLELVGLNKEHANRFPHEFSGGQRQRIGIARALAINPEFIVCDEPISALDVSIQAQVVNLLKKLQNELGLTYLFIAHDLSMVKYISDRVAVMYLGTIVELTTSESLYAKPMHPYTEALLSAIPIPDPDIENSRNRIILQGDLKSPINPPDECRFCGRCPKEMPKCSQKRPELKEVEKGHFVACYLYE